MELSDRLIMAGELDLIVEPDELQLVVRLGQFNVTSRSPG